MFLLSKEEKRHFVVYKQSVHVKCEPYTYKTKSDTHSPYCPVRNVFIHPMGIIFLIEFHSFIIAVVFLVSSVEECNNNKYIYQYRKKANDVISKYEVEKIKRNEKRTAYHSAWHQIHYSAIHRIAFESFHCSICKIINNVQHHFTRILSLEVFLVNLLPTKVIIFP